MQIDPTMRIATAGLKVQSARLRVTAENLANADSTAPVPGGDPYRRKTIAVGPVRDRESGLELVEVRRYGRAPGEFPMRYEPGHPAADANGYVKRPNVEPLIELMDMREAQRSYEANLNAFEMGRAAALRLIDLLR